MRYFLYYVQKGIVCDRGIIILHNYRIIQLSDAVLVYVSNELQNI